MSGKASVFDIALTVLKYVLIVVIIMLFVSRAHEFYDMGYGIFMQKGMDEEGQGHDVVVVIDNEGSDANAIGRILEGHGLIENRNIFRVQELFSAYHDDEIAPGTYTLSTEMTVEEMLGVLTGNIEYKPENTADLIPGAAVPADTGTGSSDGTAAEPGYGTDEGTTVWEDAGGSAGTEGTGQEGGEGRP